jgi:catechol 2,3-dioxygenase-like lactoylglutathione lyase family enzyme
MSTTSAFHLSLSVSDVARSTAFYQSLFCAAPVKQVADYAKFEIDDPTLVLSLIPGPVIPGGTLNHVGLRMSDRDALIAVQYRLEAAGYATQRENDVACCYSRQTKFWVTDPDRTLWEIYVIEPADVDPKCSARVTAQAPFGDEQSIAPRKVVNLKIDSSSALGAASWQHWLGQPIPGAIPHADASLNEVRLEGAFNLQLPPGRLGRLLAEVKRVLRPSALLYVHGLVADRILPSSELSLPGPAALVERVPLAAEPARCVAAAGFVNVRQEPCRDEPYFVVDGIGLRELKLIAEKPA